VAYDRVKRTYSINWLVFVSGTECIYCAIQTGSLYIIQVIPCVKRLRYSQGEFANYEPSGYYMYRQFNSEQLYVLLTQCIYVFCVDLRTAIIPLYSIN
jgi:hypothetical protein